jgi:hypothetical protein
MKRIKSKWLQLQVAGFFMLTLLAFVVFPSCENAKDETNVTPKKREVVQKGGLFYSGCKDTNLKSTYAKKACVTLQTVDSNYLDIQHFDAVFNCVFDSLAIDYNVDGNVINVKESHVNPNAFCTCKYDIEYKIGPLEYGTYSINILDESLNKNEVCFDFEFTENTQMTFYQDFYQE